MTCIVAVRTDDGIWMGGDSAGTDGWLRQHILATSKVWRADEYLYGICGSLRMGDLLRYKFSAPKPFEGDDVRSYLAGRWMDDLRKCFKDGGFNREKDGADAGGTFLVGYRGHLMMVQDNYSLVESADGLLAVGCGDEYAMGALHASDGRKPEARVQVALEAAARFSAGVAPPFHIEHLATGKEKAA